MIAILEATASAFLICGLSGLLWLAIAGILHWYASPPRGLLSLNEERAARGLPAVPPGILGRTLRERLEEGARAPVITRAP